VEDVVTAVVAEIMELNGLTFEEGGFSDEMPLPDPVWWGNPGILPDPNYPYIYVEPVTSVKKSETTGSIVRTLTIRIALLADPYNLYDVDQVSERAVTLEMVRTIEAIQRRFEKTSLREPNALAPGVQSVEVPTTEYANQFRGNLISLGAAVTLLVDIKLPKSN
jgi:hypothetical protein